MRKFLVPVALFLTLAGLIGFVVARTQSGQGGGNGSASRGTSPASRAVHAPAPSLDLGVSGVTSEGTGGGSVGSGVETFGGSASDIPQIGPDIVKTAEVGVEVKKGTFADAFQQASMVAARYGGFVESSSTTAGTSGWLQLRVPASRFDLAVSDLRAIGKVKRESLSGQDVTSQFVDLSARLRTWRAQEAVLLRLMSKAATIGDTLRIQDQLQPVQVRIEQLRGELRVLRNQTALATIQFAIREAGPITPAPKGTPRPSLSRAWSLALAGFLGVLYSVVVGLGYLIPISIIAAVGWLVIRRLWRPRVAAQA